MSEATRRRDRLRAICAQLPEADAGNPWGQHLKFTVRGKTFAYYLNDHHGDGMVALACKAPEGQQAAPVRIAPGRFFAPAYLGANGWVGLRLDGRKLDWAEVDALVTESYPLVAPKRLAAP